MTQPSESEERSVAAIGNSCVIPGALPARGPESNLA
jgi:hypothetical protein